MGDKRKMTLSINGKTYEASELIAYVEKLEKESLYYKDIIETNTAEWEEQGQRVVVLEKENAELKKKVAFLEDNLRVARKDREDLQLDVAKGLKEFVKDYPATALRYLANEKYVEQLTKAKKIIKILADDLSIYSGNYQKELLEARQFLSEVEK